MRPGDDTLSLYLAAEISAEIAIVRLLLAGWSAEEIAAASERHPGRGATLAALARGRSADVGRVAAMLADVGFDPRASSVEAPAVMARVAAMYDRAVALGPEMSVAAYSLGDPAILGQATAEIIEWLDDQGFLDGAADVLDIGCGIGRISCALAPSVRSVVGLDVSHAMIAEAERRRGGIPNVSFAVTDGLALARFSDNGFDLVLGIDCFPYMMVPNPAIAEQHVRDAARILRPGGSLVILNLSYRGDSEADRDDLAEWGRRYGLRPTLAGTRPFKLWDGAAFVLQKPASE